jgi:HK97 family phage major capsid protein
MEQRFARLVAQLGEAFDARKAITDKLAAEKREELTQAETASYRKHTDQFNDLRSRISELQVEMDRSGIHSDGAIAVRKAQQRVDAARGGSGGWAARAATAIISMGGETRAVTSGSLDVPQLIESEVVSKPRPERLIDLFTNRKALESNVFEYFRQSLRTNAAAPVADNAVKPTSQFVVDPIEDRARVIAHLSEPVPMRLFADHPQLESWLSTEMAEGVLDRVESQAITGSGVGENITGLLATAGMTAVPFTTDLPTTLRSAVTMLQLAGVTPNGWVLHPNDAQKIDLLRYQSGGETAVNAGFLLDGYQGGVAGSGNVFGPTTPRVVSASVPEGTAVLADWDQLCLYVREGMRIDVDAGGVLFTKNQIILRAETRVGVGVLRPVSFAVVDLTA